VRGGAPTLQGATRDPDHARPCGNCFDIFMVWSRQNNHNLSPSFGGGPDYRMSCGIRLTVCTYFALIKNGAN
jgi:hypothetical protein